MSKLLIKKILKAVGTITVRTAKEELWFKKNQGFFVLCVSSHWKERSYVEILCTIVGFLCSVDGYFCKDRSEEYQLRFGHSNSYQRYSVDYVGNCLFWATVCEYKAGRCPYMALFNLVGSGYRIVLVVLFQGAANGRCVKSGTYWQIKRGNYHLSVFPVFEGAGQLESDCGSGVNYVWQHCHAIEIKRRMPSWQLCHWGTLLLNSNHN